MEFDHFRLDQWFGLDAGFHYSDDDSGGGIGQTTEMFVGARKTFTIASVFHPYLAAGVAYIWATNGVSGATIGLPPQLIVAEQDSSFGFYGRGGVYVTIADHINIGLDIRALTGTDVDVFGADADYVQGAVTVGWGF